MFQSLVLNIKRGSDSGPSVDGASVERVRAPQPESRAAHH